MLLCPLTSHSKWLKPLVYSCGYETIYFFPNTTLCVHHDFSFSSCGKNNSPGGGSVNPTVLRPAKMKFYDGPIGTLGTVWTYEYDKNNLLTKFGEAGKHFRIITSGLSQLQLFYQDIESTTKYVYNSTASRYNIYEPKNQPAVVSVQTSIHNLTYNQVTQPGCLRIAVWLQCGLPGGNRCNGSG